MIPKPCRKNTCAGTTTHKSGYCDKHKGEGWNSWHTGNTTQRGYGHKWRQIRKRIIQRDSGLCQVCLNNGRIVEGTDVDHIKEKARGGTDDPSNLQLLCRECHNEKTGRAGEK